jgi:acetoin utilization deacetylase AcuC-like enzyme
MNRCGLLYDPVFLDHHTGHGHPECPNRVAVAYQAIEKAGLVEKSVFLKPQTCKAEALERVHSKSYLSQAEKDIKQGATQLSTGDTSISKDSWKVAHQATGGIVGALDQIMSGSIDRAFCLTRPPGHHATPTRGMGFCIFNHAAVVARHAQSVHGVGKVLIVDWDVHHGNGTQDVFYNDESVYFFSTHQSPWYPGTGNAEETGTGKGLGYNRNHPLPAGAGNNEIVQNAFADDLTHRMDLYRPELVIISAGFDSKHGDPLGQFQLTDNDFSELTRVIRSIAKEYAESRVLSILEGGYDLDGLSQACVAHLGALI